MYRLAEDAWESDLKPWLMEHADSVLAGELPWVVVPARSQVGWIRRRCLESGISLLGIKFLTPASLRREMSRLLGLKTTAMGRESLEFLLRLQALKGKGAVSQSVALSPSNCLQALDDLGRAGWTGEETDLGEVPSPVKDWLKILSLTGAWTPTIDQNLVTAAFEKNRQEQSPIHVLFYAWDAGLFPEIRLLEATLALATSANLLVPSPRGTSPDPDMLWIEYLEKITMVQAVDCPASGFISKNEAFVEKLTLKGEGGTNFQPVPLLVGFDAEDQLALVIKQLVSWLQADFSHSCVALIFPNASSLALRMTRELTRLGYPFYDEVGFPEYPEADMQVQQALANYYLSQGNVHRFLELLEVLSLEPKIKKWPDPIKARAELHKRFGKAQSQLMSQLVSHIDDDSSLVLMDIHGLVAELSEWPEEGSWEELKKMWQGRVGILEIDLKKLEPLWSRMDEVLRGRVIPVKPFLQHILALTCATKLTRSAEGNQPFARIVLTTQEQAADRTWSHVCFLESNQGVWPHRAKENCFLDDNLRKKLNAQQVSGHAPLLTSSDLGRLEQRRFLDILENTLNPAVFSAQSQNVAAPEKTLYPNEWFLQCLLLNLANTSPVLKQWELMIQRKPSQILAADNFKNSSLATQLKHLHHARNSRLNPVEPFNEYLFYYGTSDPKPWSVTDLEKAIKTPATFALKQLFGVESSQAYPFERKADWIVGIVVHDWLRRLVEAHVAGQAKPTFEQLKTQYQANSQPTSFWWQTIFSQAQWITKACWKKVVPYLAHSHVEVEHSLKGIIKTAQGDLELKGRLDFTARNQAEWRGSTVTIIDYKTKNNTLPSAEKLEQADGLQFAAYLALAELLGAADVNVQCVNPYALSEKMLTLNDRQSAWVGLTLAAQIKASLNFGTNGLMRVEHNKFEQENLPVATLPIPLEIIKAKQKLAQAASVSFLSPLP